MTPTVVSFSAGDDRIGGLADEARARGFRHIDRLIDGWRSGANRFDRTGETLLAIFDGDAAVAIGGLNVDPYAGDDRVARIRHVYVMENSRRAGLGRMIVGELVDEARQRFDLVRVRAASKGGAALFYDALGFCRVNLPDATHLLPLNH